ncbi:hypothetical protein [Persicirhabdus sediminis]|uniref:Uncharacterized protein n=1 Tax=Persicirhabdus sediminis TaxID=454144 RepID=A0A8J7SN54_9BACT|nr:hypothetical protein [Persicirhabdus sediminis]MBK1791493.1 hypothetical protein [Persicirhabdus sediminis]
MAYLISLALLIFSHITFKRGVGGCRIAKRIEKGTILLTTLAFIYALVELADAMLTRFASQLENYPPHTGDAIAVIGGIVAFLVFVFILLPKPIPSVNATVAELV